jgi:hypothetical protein
MDHFAEIFFLSSTVLFTTTIGFAIAWVRARERAIRAESLMDGARTARLPQENYAPAIDAIAMEVERIGEGQRFLTKVLAEQQQGGKKPRIPGSITPH